MECIRKEFLPMECNSLLYSGALVQSHPFHHAISTMPNITGSLYSLIQKIFYSTVRSKWATSNSPISVSTVSFMPMI